MSVSLDSFDEDFKPDDKQGVALESLPDGDYCCIITRAFLDVTKKSSDNIYKMFIKVIAADKTSDGPAYERPSFLTSQDSVNRLARDLQMLGFDTENWKKANGRPFSGEIAKVGRWLTGMKFYGKKTSNMSSGKMYHNMNIVRRTGDDDMPAKVTPEQLNEVDPENPF